MELLQTGGVSLKADILNFLIEIFGCIFEQLVVLNRLLMEEDGLTMNTIVAPIPKGIHHG